MLTQINEQLFYFFMFNMIFVFWLSLIFKNNILNLWLTCSLVAICLFAMFYFANTKEYFKTYLYLFWTIVIARMLFKYNLLRVCMKNSNRNVFITIILSIVSISCGIVVFVLSERILISYIVSSTIFIPWTIFILSCTNGYKE
jgi:peptidoglycan/LPS O-acetylase OafA/YrhL